MNEKTDILLKEVNGLFLYDITKRHPHYRNLGNIAFIVVNGDFSVSKYFFNEFGEPYDAFDRALRYCELLELVHVN